MRGPKPLHYSDLIRGLQFRGPAESGSSLTWGLGRSEQPPFMSLYLFLRAKFFVKYQLSLQKRGVHEFSSRPGTDGSKFVGFGQLLCLPTIHDLQLAKLLLLWVSEKWWVGEDLGPSALAHPRAVATAGLWNCKTQSLSDGSYNVFSSY